jgi:hypothetical protein
VTIVHQSPQVDDRVDRSHNVPGRQPRGRVAVSVATSACALLYAAYRGYYAFGGTAGMIGVPRSWSEFRHLNAVAVGVLLVAAIIPLAALPLWRRPNPRRALLALCWVVAVGCVMHALIDDAQRVVSLAGGPAVAVPTSQWVSVDRHAADVQDLAFNEVFFLVEGFLWAALAVIGLGSPRLVSTSLNSTSLGRTRRWWMASAAVGIAVLTAIGLLSAFGVIGRLIVG